MKKKVRQKSFLYNTPFFVFFEKLYVFFLKNVRSKEKYPLISADDLSRILTIARNVYPENLQYEVVYNDEKELLQGTSCLDPIQLYRLVTDSFYLVIGAHYNCYAIVDFAAVNGKCNEIFEVYDFILRNFKGKPFAAKCREKTSYPLIRAFERAGRIKIVDSYTRTEYGEVFHVVKFKAKRRD